MKYRRNPKLMEKLSWMFQDRSLGEFKFKFTAWLRTYFFRPKAS